MNFLNPLVLFGLFAASIPIILHLLNLRKLKRVDFSTLKFLKELQKTKIKKIKLKQIILLILRTLIIIFIVLAFSRPAIKSSIPFMENYAKSSSIILFDNSFSMDLSDEYGNRLNQAKKYALEIINNLKEGDEAAIIKMADLNDRTQFEFSRNLNLVKENIESIKISNSKAELINSLKMCAALLQKNNNINREIYIITDAQNNIFDTSDSIMLKGLNAGVYFVPVGNNSEADLGNLSVDSLKVISEIFALGKAVEAEAFIKNNTDYDAAGVVVSLLFNGQRVSQRTVDLPANSTRAVAISSVPSKSGSIKAEIQIEGDPLEIDNSRYFSFLIPDSPKIAINGSKLSYQLIYAALKSAYKNSEPTISYFDNNNFMNINYGDYDLVILGDGSPSISANALLAEYVNNGGALLIYSSAFINESLQDLSAKIGFGELNQYAYNENSPGTFTEFDKQHPIFEGVFSEKLTQNNVIESANIYSLVAPSNGIPIIKAQNYSFLSESRLGKGKAFFIGVSADLSMSNFPLTGIFAAINFKSVMYLTALDFTEISTICGSPIYVNIPSKFANESNLRISDPNGNESFASPAALPGGLVLNISNTSLPGVYEVFSSNHKIITNFSVNTLPSESYYPIYDDEIITQYFQERFDETSEIIFIESTDNLTNSIIRARLGTELWQLMIILALLCAAAELLVQKSTKKDLA